MSAKILLRIAMFFGALLTVLFVSAGRLDMPFFWMYAGLTVLSLFSMIRLIDPGLLQERMKPGPGGTDRRLRITIMPVLIAQLIIAGLDAGRYGWSQMPIGWQFAGLAGHVCGGCLSLWAMYVNRFFSPVVRIQSERGHHVVDTGPYRVIRHPGYLAVLVLLPSTAFLLGSWWALLPAGVSAALILRRAVIEDRFLHENLTGYHEYAQHVRWRLLPGVW